MGIINGPTVEVTAKPAFYVKHRVETSHHHPCSTATRVPHFPAVCDSMTLNILPPSTVGEESTTDASHSTPKLACGRPLDQVADQPPVNLKVTLIDTPGYGDSTNLETAFEKIVDYVDAQFHAHRAEEEMAKRGTHQIRGMDPLIHCVLYFIAPHRIKPVDVAFMLKLHKKVCCPRLLSSQRACSLRSKLPRPTPCFSLPRSQHPPPLASSHSPPLTLSPCRRASSQLSPSLTR